jgi:hypothetical protein
VSKSSKEFLKIDLPRRRASAVMWVSDLGFRGARGMLGLRRIADLEEAVITRWKRR